MMAEHQMAGHKCKVCNLCECDSEDFASEECKPIVIPEPVQGDKGFVWGKKFPLSEATNEEHPPRIHPSHRMYTPEDMSHKVCDDCGYCTCFFEIRLGDECLAKGPL